MVRDTLNRFNEYKYRDLINDKKDFKKQYVVKMIFEDLYETIKVIYYFIDYYDRKKEIHSVLGEKKLPTDIINRIEEYDDTMSASKPKNVLRTERFRDEYNRYKKEQDALDEEDEDNLIGSGPVLSRVGNLLDRIDVEPELDWKIVSIQEDVATLKDFLKSVDKMIDGAQRMYDLITNAKDRRQATPILDRIQNIDIEGIKDLVSSSRRYYSHSGFSLFRAEFNSIERSIRRFNQDILKLEKIVREHEGKEGLQKLPTDLVKMIGSYNNENYVVDNEVDEEDMGETSRAIRQALPVNLGNDVNDIIASYKAPPKGGRKHRRLVMV
jgi:hypothetical protein